MILSEKCGLMADSIWWEHESHICKWWFTPLKESIIQLLNDGIKDISANVVFEDVWKEGDDQVFEEQLKQLADYIIDNDLYNEFRCTLFSDAIGGSYTEDDLTNTSCGAGKMLALGPNGDIYPCMRYYDYSLNKKKDLL